MSEIAWKTGIPSTVGEICHVCQDEDRRFRVVDRVVVFALPDGAEHPAHEGCFWKSRAEHFESQSIAAAQALAIVVASKGGIVTVSRKDVEKAQTVRFEVQAEQLGNGNLRYRLPGKTIEIIGAAPEV